jgi:hypothetical protein
MLKLSLKIKLYLSKKVLGKYGFKEDRKRR